MAESPSATSAARDLGAWPAFAGLILARTSVSLQYQNITVLGLDAGGPLHLEPTQIGLLLTLYTMFGLVAAIISPLIIQRVGAITPIRLALILMAIGQLAMIEPYSFAWVVLCRVLTGLGGSLIYIVALDAVAGLVGFGGLVIRMGLIAATWPLGNALALVLAYPLAMLAGTAFALSIPLWTALPAVVLLTWRAVSPMCMSREVTAAPLAFNSFLRTWFRALSFTWPIGLAFAFYNTAFILFTSLSAPLFVAQGYSPFAAGQLASTPMWLFLASVPAGGLIATRLSQSQTIIVAGCAGSAVAFALVSLRPADGVWVAVAGLLGGIPTAPLLALAAERARAFADLAYGTMFAMFFAVTLALPPVVGWFMEQLGPQALVVAIIVLLALPVVIIERTTKCHRAERKRN